MARFAHNKDGMYALEGTEDEEVNTLLISLLRKRKFTTPRSLKKAIANIGSVMDNDTSDEQSDLDEDTSVLGTVESPTNAGKRKPSKADKERASQAMRYHEFLNHPSDRVLKLLLKAGGIRGCDLKPEDVALGRLLEGPCSHCQRAKATVTSKQSQMETTAPPPYVGHTWHADICYTTGNKPNIRICEDLTKYGALIPIARKDKASILDALQVWFGSMLATTDKPARRLRTDNETVFSSMADDLARSGILLQQSPTGNHAGKIERATRTDREGLRTLLSGLPYKVPSNLHIHAAIDVVRMRNLVRNSSTGDQCPYTIVTKRKPTIDDIAVPWGSIVYATDPNVREKTAPKADLGVVIAHNFANKAGSVDILVIDDEGSTLKVVNRPSRLLKPASGTCVDKVKKFMERLAKTHPPIPTAEDIIQFGPITESLQHHGQQELTEMNDHIGPQPPNSTPSCTTHVRGTDSKSNQRE